MPSSTAVPQPEPGSLAAAARSPSGSRELCLLSSAAQPQQPALVPQSWLAAPRNTLLNSLETPAFWAESQQEEGIKCQPTQGAESLGFPSPAD